MKLWSKLSTKRKRMALGLVMMAMFFALSNTIYFFMRATADFTNLTFKVIAFFFMLGYFWYLWVPSVLCIILVYYILMRVIKYQEVDNE